MFLFLILSRFNCALSLAPLRFLSFFIFLILLFLSSPPTFSFAILEQQALRDPETILNDAIDFKEFVSLSVTVGYPSIG